MKLIARSDGVRWISVWPKVRTIRAGLMPQSKRRQHSAQR